MKKIGYILISLLALWLCFHCGLKKGAEKEPQIVEIIKTVKVTDTVEIPEPIPYLVENTDIVYVEDIKYANEPLKVPLIKQRVTYTDSTYKAVVSGYNPKLEYIETYNTTHYITEKVYEKPKKWNIYAFTELGISNVPNFNAGLGFSYTHNRWTIGAEAGKEIIRSNNFVKIKGSFAFARF